VDVEPEGDGLAFVGGEVGGDLGPGAVVVAEFEQAGQDGAGGASYLSFHPVVSAGGSAAGVVGGVWLVPEGKGGGSCGGDGDGLGQGAVAEGFVAGGQAEECGAGSGVGSRGCFGGSDATGGPGGESGFEAAVGDG